MSKFSTWFNSTYKKWNRTQPGEEDFLAFCDMLGYSPDTVLSWLHSDSEPQGAELLSIAGLFGTKFYSLLNQPEPDPELMKIYQSFAHLHGEYRSKLAHALWEAQNEMVQKGFTASSEEAKPILSESFKRWGFESSGNK